MNNNIAKTFLLILVSTLPLISYAGTLVIDKQKVIPVDLDHGFKVEAYKVHLNTSEGPLLFTHDPRFKFDQEVTQLKIITQDGVEVDPLQNLNSFSPAFERIKHLLTYLEKGSQTLCTGYYGKLECKAFMSYVAMGKMNGSFNWQTLTALNTNKPRGGLSEQEEQQYFGAGQILQLYCDFNTGYNIKTHNFMTLGHDVMVSKFGDFGVLFTSFPEILKTYVPQENVKECVLKLGTLKY